MEKINNVFETLKEYFKVKLKSNYDTIKILLFFAIVLFAIIMNRPIQQTDELILFNDIQKMVNGYTIYKDFNVLQTPIFFYFGQIFLKVFVCNYVCFRIYGILIYLFLFYNILKLFQRLDIPNKHSFIYLTILTLFLKNDVIIVCGANYNILAIAFAIMGLRYLIKNENKSTKFFVCEGILTGIIFLTKQTVGVYSAFAFAICYVLLDNDEIKNKVKNLWLCCAGGIGVLAIYVLYLLCINSLSEFIDYTILGMFDFSQNITAESYVIIYAIINIIPITVLWIKGKINKEQKTLLIYSILMLLITYPILCEFHSRMALIFSVISLAYFIDNELNKEIVEYIAFDLSVIVVALVAVYNIYMWKSDIIGGTKVYNFTTYNQYMYNKLRGVTEYINKSDKNVIFLSLESAIYSNELGENNGILDYPAKGNMGYNGLEKMLNALKNLDSGTKIILTPYRYEQEYEEMYEYVYDNYTQVEKILDYFEVYEKIKGD